MACDSTIFTLKFNRFSGQNLKYMCVCVSAVASIPGGGQGKRTPTPIKNTRARVSFLFEYENLSGKNLKRLFFGGDPYQDQD